MKVPPGPLGLLTEVVQNIGFEVTYEHDDLVFVTNNLFILRLTETSKCIELYFNEEIEEEKAETLMTLMEVAAQGKGVQVEYKGAFCLTPQEDDNVEIKFFDLTDA